MHQSKVKETAQEMQEKGQLPVGKLEFDKQEPQKNG